MARPKILILGSSGQLAREFIRQLSRQSWPHAAPPEADCDITKRDELFAVMERIAPDVVVNCAAYNAVDAAEDDEERAVLINHPAVKHVTEYSAERRCRLVHFSTDYVFDGTKEELYTEEDLPNPLGVYGRSKLAGERTALEDAENALVFRLSWVFGDGPQNFIYKLRQWASKNQVLKISADEVSVPTYTEDVAAVVLRAIESELSGLYHLPNSGYASRYEFARHIAETLRLKNMILPVPMSSFPLKALRPAFSAMSNGLIAKTLGVEIPHWREAVTRFLKR